MEEKRKRPNHPSYRLHRSQVAWQVIVPVAVALLLLIAATVLVSLSTFRGNGDVDRWAAISTMWLTIPVIVGALIMLLILGALVYVIALAIGFIPPYTHQAQVFMSQVEAGVKRGAEFAHHPRLLIPEIEHLIRSGFQRIRGS